MASLKVPFTCPKPHQGPSSPGHVKFYSDRQHLGNFSHESCQSAHLFLVHFKIIIFQKHQRLPKRHTWVHSLILDSMLLLSLPLDFSSWFVSHYSGTSSLLSFTWMLACSGCHMSDWFSNLCFSQNYNCPQSLWFSYAWSPALYWQERVSPSGESFSLQVP